MEILDATIITTALPAIAADFGVPATHLSVGVSAYLVAVTIFIPLSGWAADRFGAKTIFILAIVVFMCASVLCGLSTSLAEFTAARALQGLGGAMMVPVGRLVVLRDVPKSQLVRAMAILTWPALGAPLIGPVLGGWIAETWHWSWIFFINVPLGMLALVASYLLLTNHKGSHQHFDLVGFALSGCGFGLLMSGLEMLSGTPSAWQIPSVLIGTGAGLLLLAVRHMRRAANPLFSLSAWRVPTFRTTLLGGAIIRIALSSAPFIIPLMLQLGLGYSAVQAGTLLLWLFIGNLAIKPATTWLMNRCGFKLLLISNTLLVALGYAILATATTTTPTWVLAVMLLFCGMARSVHLTVLNTLGFADIPAERIRDANTLSVAVMQMTRGLGITAAALALALTGLINSNGSIDPSLADFQLTMLIMAAIAACSIIDNLRLAPDAGSSVLTRRRATSDKAG